MEQQTVIAMPKAMQLVWPKMPNTSQRLLNQLCHQSRIKQLAIRKGSGAAVDACQRAVIPLTKGTQRQEDDLTVGHCRAIKPGQA